MALGEGRRADRAAKCLPLGPLINKEKRRGEGRKRGERGQGHRSRHSAAFAALPGVICPAEPPASFQSAPAASPCGAPVLLPARGFRPGCGAGLNARTYLSRWRMAANSRGGRGIGPEQPLAPCASASRGPWLRADADGMASHTRLLTAVAPSGWGLFPQRFPRRRSSPYLQQAGSRASSPRHEPGICGPESIRAERSCPRGCRRGYRPTFARRNRGSSQKRRLENWASAHLLPPGYSGGKVGNTLCG